MVLYPEPTHQVHAAVNLANGTSNSIESLDLSAGNVNRHRNVCPIGVELEYLLGLRPTVVLRDRRPPVTIFSGQGMGFSGQGTGLAPITPNMIARMNPIAPSQSKSPTSAWVAEMSGSILLNM